MAIDRVKDINVFVHVAEAKSFTAASERIGLSRSAVGKSIVRLEDRLGVRLLQRTTRSVSLTGEGAAFHERCVRLLADLDEAEMAMLSHSQAPRGRLPLHLPVSFGRLHVLPILNRFMHKWPEISVSASFNDRYVDLIDEGVDLAIRIGEAEDGRLRSRLLARHRLVRCPSSTGRPPWTKVRSRCSVARPSSRKSSLPRTCSSASASISTDTRCARPQARPRRRGLEFLDGSHLSNLIANDNRWHEVLTRGEEQSNAHPIRSTRYFTNAHPPSVSGRNAWSADIVDTSL